MLLYRSFTANKASGCVHGSGKIADVIAMHQFLMIRIGAYQSFCICMLYCVKVWRALWLVNR
jgi:hypothetical protein